MNRDLKLVLINVKGEVDEYWGYYPPLGILSLASFALAQKVVARKNILILDANFPYLRQRVQEFQPDIIGFSCYTLHYPKALKVASEIKKISQALLVVGGPHISLDPASLQAPFEIGVVGEGETTFTELLRAFRPSFLEKRGYHRFKKINGLVILEEGNKKFFTPPRESLDPIDTVPPLDWTLLPDVYFRSEPVNIAGHWKCLPVMPLFTSRGCPYKCVFCARHYIGRTIRYFSPEHVAQEVKALVKKHHVAAIHIWDDLFVIAKRRIEMIAEALEKEGILDQVVFFRVFARTDLITRESMAAALKKLNVVSLSFGFESGSKKILRYLKNDTTTPQDNLRAIRLCRKYNFGMVANLIVGSPEEKIADLKKTYHLALLLANTLQTEVMEVNRLTPIPGTPLWEEAKGRHIIPETSTWQNETYIDQKNSDPLLMTDAAASTYYQKMWPKFKALETKVQARKNRSTYWRQAYATMQARKRRKEKLIPLDLIKQDLQEGRVSLAWRMAKIILLNEVGQKIKRVFPPAARIPKLLKLNFGSVRIIEDKRLLQVE